jgi:hypothetical protein
LFKYVCKLDELNLTIVGGTDDILKDVDAFENGYEFVDNS